MTRIDADARADSALGLADAVACVTGGANGIGRGCTLALARAGASVVTIDPDVAATAEVEALAATLPGKVVGSIGDVRRAEDLQAAIDRATELGGIDVLVNNAGGLLSTVATPTLDVTEDDWTEVVDFNLRPVFLGSTLAARAMIERGSGGSIVNVSASLALRSAPHLAAYAAAKAAVNQLTQTLAVEFAPNGIRVNAVAPAFTETPASLRHSGDIKGVTTNSIPLGRVAQPEDIAGVVVFLASRLAAFVTGQTILVDGGLMCTTARPNRTMIGRSAPVPSV